MSNERRAAPCRGIVFAMLLGACAACASCSTVRTFISSLEQDFFAAEDGAEGRKIPLPPMAEDFGATESEASQPPDAER